MKPLKFILPLAILLMSAVVPTSGKYNLAKDYTVTINGTSNLHNWNEKVEAAQGSSDIIINGDGSFDINAVNLVMQVRSIKSDSKIMDNNTYKALKADAHPEITLALAEPVKSAKVNGGAGTISAKCNLTIAGVTKAIVMQVKVMMPDKNAMQFEGSQTVKMTDYGITPPVALFGALITGDEITIHFKTTFSIAAS
jgi:polyisoprenoid-binding protein YceI